MIKFRSMIVGAQKTGTGVYSFEHDIRITKVGKFIRKTSIDELPQIINVLIGNMAFVGPRAPVYGHFPDHCYPGFPCRHGSGSELAQVVWALAKRRAAP